MHVPKIEKSTYLVIALLSFVYEFGVSDSKQEEGNFMLSCFPGVFFCADLTIGLAWTLVYLRCYYRGWWRSAYVVCASEIIW